VRRFTRAPSASQFLFQMLVTAIQVVDAFDQRLALATSPAITRLAEARRSVAITVAPSSLATPCHEGRIAVDLDVGAQTLQLHSMHEAVLENGFANDRCALGHRIDRHELCLHVGRKCRIRRVRRLTEVNRCGALIRIALRSDSMSQPASISLSTTASR
jgi:hypothetical protein